MEIKILGNGQDAGAPYPGCSCPQCGAGISAHGPAITVSKGEKTLLIDAPHDIIRMIDLRIPDAILLTHAHIGHYGGLFFLGKESYNTEEFPVHCSKEMAEWLRGGNKAYHHLVERGNIEIDSFSTDEWIEIEGVEVKPVEVNHRNEDADTVGFLFRDNGSKLLYMPDLDEWTEKEDNLVREADIAIVDGTFYSEEEMPRSDVPHPPVEETRERFEDTDTRIVFTHLNHSNPLLDQESQEYKDLVEKGGEVALQGDTYRIS